jgi:hypothetical protein
VPVPDGCPPFFFGAGIRRCCYPPLLLWCWSLTVESPSSLVPPSDATAALATPPSPRRTLRQRSGPWTGRRRISPGERRISPSGKTCSPDEARCWPSMSSKQKRRRGSWRSGSTSSTRHRRHRAPSRWRPPGGPLKIFRRSTTPGSSASPHGPARRARHWCR